jgi:hypothetical protein
LVSKKPPDNAKMKCLGSYNLWDKRQSELMLSRIEKIGIKARNSNV